VRVGCVGVHVTRLCPLLGEEEGWKIFYHQLATHKFRVPVPSLGVAIASAAVRSWQLLTVLCPCVLALQGGGVFCNPKSPSAPAKLRLLYECAPLALIVEVRWGNKGGLCFKACSLCRPYEVASFNRSCAKNV
jgi:hypothetical protein